MDIQMLIKSKIIAFIINVFRNAANGKMALLVPKGIQRFPDTGDSVKVS